MSDCDDCVIVEVDPFQNSPVGVPNHGNLLHNIHGNLGMRSTSEDQYERIFNVSTVRRQAIRSDSSSPLAERHGRGCLATDTVHSNGNDRQQSPQLPSITIHHRADISDDVGETDRFNAGKGSRTNSEKATFRLYGNPPIDMSHIYRNQWSADEKPLILSDNVTTASDCQNNNVQSLLDLVGKFTSDSNSERNTTDNSSLETVANKALSIHKELNRDSNRENIWQAPPPPTRILSVNINKITGPTASSTEPINERVKIQISKRHADLVERRRKMVTELTQILLRHSTSVELRSMRSDFMKRSTNIERSRLAHIQAEITKDKNSQQDIGINWYYFRQHDYLLDWLDKYLEKFRFTQHTVERNEIFGNTCGGTTLVTKAIPSDNVRKPRLSVNDLNSNVQLAGVRMNTGKQPSTRWKERQTNVQDSTSALSRSAALPCAPSTECSEVIHSEARGLTKDVSVASIQPLNGSINEHGQILEEQCERSAGVFDPSKDDTTIGMARQNVVVIPLSQDAREKVPGYIRNNCCNDFQCDRKQIMSHLDNTQQDGTSMCPVTPVQDDDTMRRKQSDVVSKHKQEMRDMKRDMVKQLEEERRTGRLRYDMKKPEKAVRNLLHSFALQEPNSADIRNTSTRQWTVNDSKVNKDTPQVYTDRQTLYSVQNKPELSKDNFGVFMNVVQISNKVEEQNKVPLQQHSMTVPSLDSNEHFVQVQKNMNRSAVPGDSNGELVGQCDTNGALGFAYNVAPYVAETAMPHVPHIVPDDATSPVIHDVVNASQSNVAENVTRHDLSCNFSDISSPVDLSVYKQVNALLERFNSEQSKPDYICNNKAKSHGEAEQQISDQIGPSLDPDTEQNGKGENTDSGLNNVGISLGKNQAIGSEIKNNVFDDKRRLDVCLNEARGQNTTPNSSEVRCFDMNSISIDNKALSSEKGHEKSPQIREQNTSPSMTSPYDFLVDDGNNIHDVSLGFNWTLPQNEPHLESNEILLSCENPNSSKQHGCQSCHFSPKRFEDAERKFCFDSNDQSHINFGNKESLQQDLLETGDIIFDQLLESASTDAAQNRLLGFSADDSAPIDCTLRSTAELNSAESMPLKYTSEKMKISSSSSSSSVLVKLVQPFTMRQVDGNTAQPLFVITPVNKYNRTPVSLEPPQQCAGGDQNIAWSLKQHKTENRDSNLVQHNTSGSLKSKANFDTMWKNGTDCYSSYGIQKAHHPKYTVTGSDAITGKQMPVYNKLHVNTAPIKPIRTRRRNTCASRKKVARVEPYDMSSNTLSWSHGVTGQANEKHAKENKQNASKCAVESASKIHTSNITSTGSGTDLYSANVASNSSVSSTMNEYLPTQHSSNHAGVATNTNEQQNSLYNDFPKTIVSNRTETYQVPEYVMFKLPNQVINGLPAQFRQSSCGQILQSALGQIAQHTSGQVIQNAPAQMHQSGFNTGQRQATIQNINTVSENQVLGNHLNSDSHYNHAALSTSLKRLISSNETAPYLTSQVAHIMTSPNNNNSIKSSQGVATAYEIDAMMLQNNASVTTSTFNNIGSGVTTPILSSHVEKLNAQKHAVMTPLTTYELYGQPPVYIAPTSFVDFSSRNQSIASNNVANFNSKGRLTNDHIVSSANNRLWHHSLSTNPNPSGIQENISSKVEWHVQSPLLNLKPNQREKQEMRTHPHSMVQLLNETLHPDLSNLQPDARILQSDSDSIGDFNSNLQPSSQDEYIYGLNFSMSASQAASNCDHVTNKSTNDSTAYRNSPDQSAECRLKSMERELEQELNVLLDKINEPGSSVDSSVKILMDKLRLSSLNGSYIGQATKLPIVARRIMQRWYERNVDSPYPSGDIAEAIAQSTGISVEQVKKWFANKRMRTGNTRRAVNISRPNEKRTSSYELHAESKKLKSDNLLHYNFH